MNLPVDEYLDTIHKSLEACPNLVIVAAPGAGKTTRIPASLLKAPWRQDKEIVVLQPRRLAAIAASYRIAEERGTKLGQEIGYQVRFDNQTSAGTRLRFVTEAILNRKLASDPELQNIAAVVLDEFHERSLHLDLALGLLRELQQLSRPDLRLIVMSATLDTAPLTAFLEAPAIEIPGRLFPIQVKHAASTPPLSTARPWSEQVAALIREAARDLTPGRHLLAFLPGRAEIGRVQRELTDWAGQAGLKLMEVHGSLSLEAQKAAIAPSPVSKILLSTNIAETSLTIDGVDTVVDSGLAKTSLWEPAHTFSQLRLSRISRASAQQRAGRAGRQFEGRCFRHWSALNETALPAFDVPEIRRSELGEALLFLSQMGIRQFESFGWFEKPPQAHLEKSRELLETLGAFTGTAELTPIGEKMVQLPLPVRLSRLVLAGFEQNSARLAVRLAALLSEKDICPPRFEFSHWRANFDSDLKLRLELLQRNSPEVDRTATGQVLRVERQIWQSLKSLGFKESGDLHFETEQIARLLLTAFQDRVCRLRRGSAHSARMVSGRGVQLSADHVLLGTNPLFFALGGLESRPDIKVSLTAPIKKEWLMAWARVDAQTRLVLDEKSRQVQVHETLAYKDLDLDEARIRKAQAHEAAEFLPQIVAQSWAEILKAQEELQHWLARVEFLKTHLPDLCTWPEWDWNRLAEEAAMGESSLSAIQQKNLRPYFEQHLKPEHLKLISEQAPAQLQMPSKKSYPVHYPSGQAPFLKVRLQEIFGLQQTPKLAQGRVPLVLHILGPNYRPVQVTADLASFWQNGYPEVRKEMRARYPKHKWP